MQNAPQIRSKSLTVDRVLLVASVVFVVVCVIKAAMMHHAISDGDVAALSASHPTGAASTTAEANEGESSAAPRSGWPR